MKYHRGALFVLILAVLFVAVPSLINWYTDWLWFGEVGYRQIFINSLMARLALGAGAFVLAFLLLAANLRFALRALAQPYIVLGEQAGGRPPLVVTRRHLTLVAMAAAAAIALFAGSYVAGEWLAVLQYLHAAPFGNADPVLGRDAGFYVFTFPVLDVAYRFLLAIVGFSLAGSIVIYVVTAGVWFGPPGAVRATPRARQHLSWLVAALMLVLAFGAWLAVPRLLIEPSGIITGASNADVVAAMPALRILVVAAVVAAALAVVNAFSARTWPLVLGLGLYLLVAIGGSLYATAVQRFVVTPNEQAKETPYIVHNIAATRKAFGLEGIEERTLSGDAVLTKQDIENNPDTIKNVRLWDHQPLLDTFGQIQEIRTYYDFVSVDNDRYVIDGQYRQIMLSVRELNSDALPNRTWINERLTFTHGYGLTLGPVNEVSGEGLPILFIKNLPPESSVHLEVKEPSVYFGEMSSDHVFVKTKAREFHYPKGDDNVYTNYSGEGGISVGSWARKLLFSARFRSLKILLSNDFTSESRVLFRRRLADRVTTIAPFLIYDGDPYMVISEGRLFWILDAYTASDRYPYSSHAPNGLNYIRNSVKIVIDAFHGTTTFYQADVTDPIARTLASVFPGFLKPLASMPEDLRRHLRYPEDIFSVQTTMYSTYHMTNPAVFYNKEDQWEVPALGTERGDQPMQPYYTIMKLPGEHAAEFIQMLPFTPRRKDNLAAWMVARSDAEHYGKLLVFAFPKQKVIFGPRQVVARISQDQAISPQITLWNQQGSEVIQGTLLVIPIEESLLYVRPLYLRASGGRIPELKRVIVAYQNQIVMEETLDEALDRLFGTAGRPAAGAASTQPPPAEAPAGEAPSGAADLAAEARAHYDGAMQALREGNWARYGEEIGKLGDVLKKMAPRQKK